MEKDEISSLREKKNNLFIGIVGSFVTTIAGLTVVALSPGIGFGVTSLAVGFGCLCYKNSKKLNETENRLIQEREHKKMMVEETEESIKVKADMLIDAIGLRKESEKKLENAKAISIFTYLLATVGALNTIINPTNLWMAVLGIGCSVAAGYYELKKYRNNEVIRNTIHNLNYDLEIVEELKSEEKIKSNENQKYIGISYSQEKEKGKEKVYVKKR